MSKYLYILFSTATSVAMLISFQVHAQSVCDPDNPDKKQSYVLYVNGVSNSRLLVQAAAIDLAEGWGRLQLNKDESRCFGHIYNPHESLLGDTAEASGMITALIRQDEEKRLVEAGDNECLHYHPADDPAAGECIITVGERRAQLADILNPASTSMRSVNMQKIQTMLEESARDRLRKGARVLLTGHSQGTLFSYTVYEKLRSENSDLYQEALGTILIGTPLPSSSNCTNDHSTQCFYFTNDNDRVIGFSEEIHGYAALPKTMNVNPEGTVSHHYFRQDYWRAGLLSRETLDDYLTELLGAPPENMNPLRYPVPTFSRGTLTHTVALGEQTPDPVSLIAATEVTPFQATGRLLPSFRAIVSNPPGLLSTTPTLSLMDDRLVIGIRPTNTTGTWTAEVLLREENTSPVITIGRIMLRVCRQDPAQLTQTFWENARPEDVSGLCDLTATAENLDRVLAVESTFYLTIIEERSTGNTALHLASGYSDDPLVVSALVEAGARVDAQNSPHLNTPLHLAALYASNPDVITTLGRAAKDARVDVNRLFDRFGQTPLHVAAFANRGPGIINALIQAGIDKDAKDNDVGNEGDRPLALAAQGHSLGSLQALIDAGADVNAADDQMGETPLHTAAFFCAPAAIVNALVDAGANLNAGAVDGGTPLHWAAAVSFCEDHTLNALINRGANTNACNNDGGTPLHVAAVVNADSFVTALINGEASVNARCPTGIGGTPLEWAIFGNADAAATVLRNNGGQCYDPETDSLYTC